MRRCNEADTIYHLAAAVLTGILFVSVTVFFRGYWTMAETASILGQAVTFTATITSPTVTVTGPVTFAAGNMLLGTAQLSRGTATFTTSALPTGSTRVQVTYSGNSNVAKSSTSLTQTVH